MVEQGDMTIAGFIRNPEQLKLYQQWRNLPMTGVMLQFLRAMHGPLGLPMSMRSGDAALYYAGGVDKYHAMVQTLDNLEIAVGAQTLAAKDLVADYGADEVLRRAEEKGEPV